MKQYKCGFSHCEHDGKVAENEAVKVGTRYWHKDCYEISELIKEIRENYINEISSSAVVSFLNKVINEIVFGKKLENKSLTKSNSNLEAARYLNFCIKYAINHKIPITHVPGLYYLIDNKSIKAAYKKEKDLKTQKEMKKEMEDIKISSEPVKVNISTKDEKRNNNIGFGSIFNGGML